MKTIYDLEKNSMDNIIMKVYGLSEKQYEICNNDYKRQLYYNYLKAMQTKYNDKKQEDIKTKILSLFKRN